MKSLHEIFYNAQNQAAQMADSEVVSLCVIIIAAFILLECVIQRFFK